MTPRILEPIEINGMRPENRLALAPFLNMPRDDDCPDEKTVRWFEERARGSLGFLMTGAVISVKPPFPIGVMGLYGDAQREAPARVVDAVHAHGAKLGVQLAMPGPLGGAGPSPAPYPDALPLPRAEKSKRVLVVGGGVAGMEAARVCRLRGHRVTLFERGAALGGMVATLALTPSTAELGNIVTYLGTRMRALEVDVRVCKETTVADVEELAPDAVIVATGTRMQLPELVQGKPWVMDHMQALRQMTAIGPRVVIWGLVATDLALSLAEQGKQVVLLGRGGVDTLDKCGPMNRRWHVFRKLTDLPFERAVPEAQRVSNPEVLFETQVLDVGAGEVDVVDQEGSARTIPYDTLIVSLMRRPDDELFEKLQGKVPEIYKIGDRLNLDPEVVETANIKGAIWSANEVARTI